MADIIEAEILDDGTISVKTDSISDANHVSADELLDEIENMAGTRRKTTPRENKFWKNRSVRLHGKIVKHGR